MSKKFKSPAIHRTPIYRARSAYYSMGRRCENKSGKHPAYKNVQLRMTMEELIEWAVPRYEKFLSERPDDTPCVARNGDSGHYKIGNIEIVSVKENRDAQRRGRKMVQLVCAFCDKAFEREQRNVVTKQRKGQIDFYCNRSCMAAHFGYGRSKGRRKSNGKRTSVGKCS